jgi:hypothetical protein
MPIDEKTAKHTIEFVWTSKKKKKKGDDEAGEIQDSQWYVSFKHNAEGGDLVSLKIGDNEADVPAELFGEVTDLLRSKGFITPKGMVSTVLVDGQNVLPLPSVGNMSVNTQPEPTKPEYVEASTMAVAGFSKKAEVPETVTLVTKTKLSDIDADTEVNELLKSIGENIVPARNIEDKKGNFKQFVPETPPEQKEKARVMRAQRMQAKKRAAEGGAKIVKRV